MGRYRNARVVEEMMQIPVSIIRKSDGLKPGQHTAWDLRDDPTMPDFIFFFAKDDHGEIHYVDQGKQIGVQHVRYSRSRVAMTTGHRLWFCCPECGLRARLLLVHIDEPTTAKCTDCHQANYAVCNLPPEDRPAWRAARIRERVSRRHGDADIAVTLDAIGFPERPKGMRRRKYLELAARYADLMLRTASPGKR